VTSNVTPGSQAVSHASSIASPSGYGGHAEFSGMSASAGIVPCLMQSVRYSQGNGFQPRARLSPSSIVGAPMYVLIFHAACMAAVSMQSALTIETPRRFTGMVVSSTCDMYSSIAAS
jgi:hypothetical protein